MRPLVLATVLLLLSLGAPGQEPPIRIEGGEIARLVNQLRSSDPIERATAAKALGGMGTKAADAAGVLAKGLRDQEATVRMLCAGALAEIGPAAQGAVPDLARALADKNPGVRTFAATTLGKLGALADGAAPALKRALSDPDPQVRKQARWAIDRVKAGVARRPDGVLTRRPDGVRQPWDRRPEDRRPDERRPEGRRPEDYPLDPGESPIRVGQRRDRTEGDTGRTDDDGTTRRPPKKRKPRGDSPDPPDGGRRPKAEPGSLTDLVGKLGSEDPAVRLAAARGIGWKGPRAVLAVPFLEKVRDEDPDPGVRAAAATAIFRIQGFKTPQRKVGTIPEPKTPPKLEGRMYYFPLYQVPTEQGPKPVDPLPDMGEYGDQHLPIIGWIDFEEVDSFRDDLRSKGSPDAGLPLKDLVTKHRKALLRPHLKPFFARMVWNGQTRYLYCHVGHHETFVGSPKMLDRKPGEHKALFSVVTEDGLRIDDVVAFKLGPPTKEALEALAKARDELKGSLESLASPLPEEQPMRRLAERRRREAIQEHPRDYSGVAEALMHSGQGDVATVTDFYRRLVAAAEAALPIEDDPETERKYSVTWLEWGGAEMPVLGTREAYRMLRKLYGIAKARMDVSDRSSTILQSHAEMRLAHLAVSGAADLNTAFDHVESSFRKHNEAWPDKQMPVPPRPTWGWWSQWVDPVEPEPEKIEPIAEEPPEDPDADVEEDDDEIVGDDEEDEKRARALRWLSSIDDALADAQRKMAAARTELALQRIAVTKIRTKITQLQKILSKAGKGDADDLFEAAVKCWDQLWDKPMPKEPAKEMRAMVEKRIVELRGQISTILKQQDELIAKVAEAYDNIVDEVDAVGPKSQYEDVRDAAKAFMARAEKHRDVTGLHLHLASGQKLKFRTAAKKVIGGSKELTGTARLMEAIEFLESKDYRSALNSVRHCLKAEPENKQAQKILQSLETGYLRAIDGKAQGDAAAVRAACWKRLSAHGEPGFWGTLADLFTTGVISSVRAISGEIMAMADLSGTMQSEAARQHCGLMIITRLREKGLTLKQIRGLTNDKFIETMTKEFKLTPGKISRKAALKMRASIQEAFRNPDVAKIASGSKLQLAVDGGSSYFETDVFQESWGEWIGDAVNMKNVIIMLGPMSVVKAGGKTAGVSYWGVTGSGAPKTLVTAKDVFANTLRLNSLADKMNKSTYGKQFVAELMKFDKTTGFVSHMLADALVQQGVMRLGKAVGGRTGELVAEVLTAYGLGDYDVAVKLLKSSGVSASQVNAVTKQIANALDQTDEMLTQTRKLAAPVNDVLDDLAQTGKLTKAARQILDDADDKLDDLAAKIAKRIDAGDVSPAALQQAHRLKTVRQAIEAAKDGQPLTARVYRDIADKMDETLESQASLLRTRKKACQAVESRLEGLGGTRKQPLSPIDEALHDSGLEGKAASVAGEFDDGAVAGMGRRPGKDWGAEADVLKWRKKTTIGGDADRLFLDGKFDQAVKKYRKHLIALDGMGKGNDDIAYELARKLRLARRARGGAKRIALLKSGLEDLSATAPISSSYAQSIIDDTASTRLVKMKESSYSSPYWVEKKIGGKWQRVGVVKQSGQGFADQLDQKAEMVYAGFAKEAGVPAPECAQVTVKMTKKINGMDAEMSVKCLYVRHVQGTTLDHVGLGTQLAVKKQMAKDRVLAALLGDHDRKMGNYMLGKGGTLWSIDHGMANLTLGNDPDFFAKVLKAGPDLGDDLVDDLVAVTSHGANHWRRRAQGGLAAAQQVGGPKGQAAARSAHKMLAVENQLSFDDMGTFIDEVRKKFTDKKIRRILEKTLSGDQLEAAVKIIKARRDNLERILKPVFKSATELSWLPGAASPMRMAA